MKISTKKILSRLLAVILILSSGCGVSHNEPEQMLPAVLETPSSKLAEQSKETVQEVIEPGDDEPDTNEPVRELPPSSELQSLSDFEPIIYETIVPDYQVAPDLSNIENILDFDFLTDSQRELLAQNHFVVVPTSKPYLYSVYEDNSQENIPSFITVDSVLHNYGIFHDYILRATEAKKYLPMLEELTEEMVIQLIERMGTINDPVIKKRYTHVLAYFSTAQMLLGTMPPHGLPLEAMEMANEEYKLIKANAAEVSKSPVTGQETLYSGFSPRGRYADSEQLRRYFEVMTLYGTLGFPFFDEQGEFLTYQTIDSLIITDVMFSNSETLRLWKNVCENSPLITGNTDGITPRRLREISIKIYGENPSHDVFGGVAGLDLMRQELLSLDNASEDLKFRFTGQRYVPDSEIMNGLTEPILRPLPTGLDVFSVLGNETAGEYLEKYYRPALRWPGYENRANQLKRRFEALPEDVWDKNAYYGWFWALKSLWGEFGEGYPRFMQTAQWSGKSLVTALGSWTEMRHDGPPLPEAYGIKREDKDGEFAPHYVEPNVSLYERLLWLMRYSRKNLEESGSRDGDFSEKMEEFESLLELFIRCSVKELRNESLSQEEASELLRYGETLKSMPTLMYVMPDVRGEVAQSPSVVSDGEMNMAVITNVYHGGANYLSEAVGYASELYVIVPVNGELYLTRGAVFDYYEFESPKRISVDEWQKVLSAGGAPERPVWAAPFISE